MAFDGIEDAEQIVGKLTEIASMQSEADLLVVASADWLVKVLVENRTALEEAGFTVPYVEQDVFDRLTSKAGFYEACERLGVPYPKTLIHHLSKGTDPKLSGFKYPLIVKASSTSEYHEIDFVGKKKVHLVDSKIELQKLLRAVKNAGYKGEFIIQDYIPGDDSAMRILTCYSDRAGVVRFSAFGEVLLEEHAPGALGNPAAIITTENSEAVEHATRLLEDAGWKGYSNFDLKFDPRDGVTKFFELNPRLGRSNYYIAAAGANPVRYYVEEWVHGKHPTPITVLGGHVALGPKGELAAEALYSVVPMTLLRRYLFNKDQRRKMNALVKRRAFANPMWSRDEVNPRRIAFVVASQLNQWRKFSKFYSRRKARLAYEAGQLGVPSQSVGS
jgi:D-aspartate ligase